MSPRPDRPFLAWPGGAHLRLAWGLTLLVSAWFCLVFGAADWVTAHRVARMRVHLDIELQIPLLPAFTTVYMSIYALFLAAPFVLRTRREIERLAVRQTITIFIAGVGFLLVPGQLAYAPAAAEDLGVWRPLFRAADSLNLTYNLVPSLHVALSWVCLDSLATRAPARTRISLLQLWGLAIMASTVLTHQHHLLDAMTGAGLAFAVTRWSRWGRDDFHGVPN